jgi:hypothetical protein
VAACIKADTGVGPSIASGNQPWKNIWADLVIAPKNKKKQIKSTNLKFKPNNLTIFIAYKLTWEKITKKSKDLKEKNKSIIPVKIKKSPTLFINIAFKADLFACNLELQKLISKKEHKPTPSQPKNNIKKFDERTSTTIKKVNNDKNDINLLLYMSEYI